MTDRLDQEPETERVAVIGMAGRFPGAQGVEELWETLRKGEEAISFLSQQELELAGVDRSTRQDPRYVPARGVVAGADLFDASFFGLTPREAMLMDPQHRLLLECAWQALEDAGHESSSFPGRIGVFAGARENTYLPNILMPGGAVRLPEDTSLLRITNDRDFLTARLSYLLGLTGPSIVVQTACSTSLSAVHLACRSLLEFESDMVLAGGVALNFPQDRGYLYEEEGIGSPDGHCRAFDDRALGCCGAGGVGVVTLRRLSDALSDGDRIHAVILASAVSNDGAARVGFTAPGVEGQLTAITEAVVQAGVDARSIGYVEAHGTGTHLGDPIEIEALTRAFRQWTDDREFCAIGSLKTNLGHMDAAAGVGGLIKTVLSLKHDLVPPSLHFERPNPSLALESSPFYVSTRAAKWPQQSTPRRAGVSSFGMGGSNVHVVLEEAPAALPTDSPHPMLAFSLSARSASALDIQERQLLDHLLAHPDLDPADVAFTLQVGRRDFDHRRVFFARDLPEAIDRLQAPTEEQPTCLPQDEGKTAPAGRTGVKDPEHAIRSLGELWLHGARVDWAGFHRHHRRRRVSLPGYPFERERCWPEPRVATVDRLPPASWFSARTWESASRPSAPHGDGLLPGPVLIFADRAGLGERLAKRLERLGRAVTRVIPGRSWDDSGDRSTHIRPAHPEDYRRLIGRLRDAGELPTTVIHLWSVSPDPAPKDPRNSSTELGFLSVLYLAQALYDASPAHSVRFSLIGSGLFRVEGGDVLSPQKSTLAGICAVIPQEYPAMAARLIDVPCPDGEEEASRTAENLWQEIVRGEGVGHCAYRNDRRRIERLAPTESGSEESGAQRLRKGGVYLITGGFGGIGLTLARGLARSVGARLALVGRTAVPEPEEWPDRLHRDDPVERRILALRELHELGSEAVPYTADVSDPKELAFVVEDTIRRWGTLDGIVHCAGLPGGTVLQLLSSGTAEKVFAAKIRGATLLDELTNDMELDFFVLCSSLSGSLGGPGNGHYAAANAFIDTFAVDRATRTGQTTVSIAWDTWQEVGMAAAAELPDDRRRRQEEALRYGLHPAEGWSTFLRALDATTSHVLVSTRPLDSRRSALQGDRPTAIEVRAAPPVGGPAFRRRPPENATAPPADELEAWIVEVWKKILGVRELSAGDDFFEMGGHSLLGLQLVRELEDKLGTSLPLSALSQFSTAEKMAAAIREGSTVPTDRLADEYGSRELPGLSPVERRGLLAVLAGIDLTGASPTGTNPTDANPTGVEPAGARPHSLIRTRHTEGSCRPLFWCFNVPDRESRRLADHLGPEQPLHVLFSGVRVLDWQQENTAARVAETYLQELLEIQPEGPIRIGGNCAGGRVACSMALRLLEMGRDVERLCLLESFDDRLLAYTSPLLLLYGDRSDLRVQDRFGWPKAGWRTAFRSPPEVHWVPGAHGEFFEDPNTVDLAKRIADFLTNASRPTKPAVSAARRRSWRHSGSPRPAPRRS